MKALLTISFMLLAFTLGAEELKEKKYYEVDKVTVAKTCPAYPVLKMIEAYKKENLEEAKKYFTEDYIKYVKRRTNGFDYLMKAYSQKMDLSKEPLKFKFYPPNDETVFIKVKFEDKEGWSTLKEYYVKKIDGKWLACSEKIEVSERVFMKKILLITLLLLMAFSISAEKREKYKRYGGVDLIELLPLDDKSYVYPVYMFLMSFKDDQPYKALDYCTEEAIYNIDSISHNVYYRFRNEYTFGDFSDLSKIRIHITEHWDSRVKLGISFPLSEKSRSLLMQQRTSIVSFYLTKKDGKYQINRIN